MSHFVVTCVTKSSDPAELEELLAPYDENLQVEKVTDEDGDEYWRNPRAKWDWWVVGGRWTGRFRGRDGGMHDQIRRGDLDLEGQIAQLHLDVGDMWKRVDAALRDLPPATRWEDLKDTLGESAPIDEVRSAFWSQPRLQAIKEIDHWNGGEAVEKYQQYDLAHLIEYDSRSRLIGYALLTAEGWEAPGEMGWWGMSSESFEEYYAFVDRAFAFVDQLPPDWWLTCVDCHI